MPITMDLLSRGVSEFINVDSYLSMMMGIYKRLWELFGLAKQAFLVRSMHPCRSI